MSKFLTRPVWIVIAALLLLALVLGIVSQYRDISWQRTYEGDSRQPFGTELLREQWPTLFAGTEPIEVHRTAFDRLVYRSQVGHSYVFINQKLPFYAESSRELLRFVQAGNQAFLATRALPPELEGVLGVAGDGMIMLAATGEGPISRDSVNLGVGQSLKTWRFPQKDAGSFFSLRQGSAAEVLGQDSEGGINFVRVPYGQGAFWLHSQPNLFGNYYVLDSLRRPYLEAVLGRMPTTDTTLWDEYYKVANLRFRPDRRQEDGSGNDEPERPNLLAYLFSQPALAWALSLVVLGLLLYTGFEAKRKQRVIPPLEPLPNTTLAFAETIGRLYHQNGDHRNLIHKRVRVLLDHIRSAYFLPTQRFDQDFLHQLAGKSGLDQKTLAQLFRRIAHLQDHQTISEDGLIELNRQIEWFYREAAR
jgi:hypothetical protein